MARKLLPAALWAEIALLFPPAGDTTTASLAPVFDIDASGSNMTEEQIQRITAATVREWWKTNRKDVINVIHQARGDRVKGV